MAESGKTLEWEAPEFAYTEKEPFWFLVGGLVAILLLLFALWQQNLLFVIFILIASATSFVWAKRKPETLTFKLNENGLRIREHDFYPWSDLKYFALLVAHEERDRFAELIIRYDRKLNPFLKIHAPPEQLDELREFLLRYLPEEEYEEPFTDAIGRMIGF